MKGTRPAQQANKQLERNDLWLAPLIVCSSLFFPFVTSRLNITSRASPILFAFTFARLG